jgi:hypothetical protein
MPMHLLRPAFQQRFGQVRIEYNPAAHADFFLDPFAPKVPSITLKRILDGSDQVVFVNQELPAKEWVLNPAQPSPSVATVSESGPSATLWWQQQANQVSQYWLKQAAKTLQTIKTRTPDEANVLSGLQAALVALKAGHFTIV